MFLAASLVGWLEGIKTLSLLYGTPWHSRTYFFNHYISREAYPKPMRTVYWSRPSVCLSVPGRIPTLLHGPGCNLGEW